MKKMFSVLLIGVILCLSACQIKITITDPYSETGEREIEIITATPTPGPDPVLVYSDDFLDISFIQIVNEETPEMTEKGIIEYIPRYGIELLIVNKDDHPVYLWGWTITADGETHDCQCMYQVFVETPLQRVFYDYTVDPTAPWDPKSISIDFEVSGASYIEGNDFEGYEFTVNINR